MPKVLIREWDKSTTGIPASDNFAVVVPGYFGDPAEIEKGSGRYYNPQDLLVGYDVYEIKSQADFINYIGRCAGSAQEATAPVLKEINTAANANEYTKYFRALVPSDFDIYLNPENKEYIYKAEVISSSSDDKYGKDGYLYRTFKYHEKIEQQVEIEGVPQYEEDGETPIMEWVASETESSITVKFTKIESLNQVTWSGAGAGPISNTTNFCIIEVGNEGADELSEPHIGNQIAYELLGLGYTVLYKKISSVNELNEADFWAPLKDKSVFNFRYIMTGGYYNAAAMNQICALANFKNDINLEEAETIDAAAGRGDCIALCDLNENVAGNEITSNLTMKEMIRRIGQAANTIQTNKYSAIFGPRVEYVMDFPENSIYQNKIFPASFHYLACAARTFDRYNEWYAVAGYTRGISNYTINKTTVKLGEIAINTLAPRIANTYISKSINLILHERGNYYLWGNRTGEALDNKGLVFGHFLNIRQLCCSIKKQLFTACKQFTFDPNSDLLWINFVNAIKPTLEAMKADQGIKGYTITRTANDKKALLTARIRIVPIEAVEDFDISIYLEDSLTGIVVNADENQA